MTNPEEILDQLRHKKALRIGILILTTLIIATASALVYASMIYEKMLDVGNTSGVTAGSGSTASGGVSFTPVAMMTLTVAGVVGISMSRFLRKASNSANNTLGRRGSLATRPISTSLDLPGTGITRNQPPTKAEHSAQASTK